MLQEDYWFRGVADNPAPLRVLTPQPRQSLDLNHYVIDARTNLLKRRGIVCIHDQAASRYPDTKVICLRAPERRPCRPPVPLPSV